MTVTIKKRKSDKKKNPLSRMHKRVSQYVAEYRSEQKILEFEFAHFSPDAIIRKTMEVIA